MALTIGEAIPFPIVGLAWGKSMPPDVSRELKDFPITALVYRDGIPDFVLLWAAELMEWRQQEWAEFELKDSEDLPEIVNNENA